MIYIFSILLLNLFFLYSYKKRIEVVNHNLSINVNNKSPFKLKKVPKLYSREIIMWLNIVLIVSLFIISRIFLIGKSETEYRNAYVDIPNEKIILIGNQYVFYIDDKLTKISDYDIDVIVDNNIQESYIQDYYKRVIKKKIENHNLFFYFNRKEDKIGKWEENNSGCGCENLKLILDKKYKLSTEKD